MCSVTVMSRKKQQPIQINSVADKMKAEAQCRLCSRLNRGSGARELTKHRLVPGRHGGEYIVANVIPLCRRCHDDVEAQDPVTRRMLRPKLWPMEVAHVLKRLGDQWFELMYPKPAQPSLSMNKIEELLGIQKERVQVPVPRLSKRKKRKQEKLVGWAWIQENPDKWYRDTAVSEKALARQRLAMKTVTTKVA